MKSQVIKGKIFQVYFCFYIFGLTIFYTTLSLNKQELDGSSLKMYNVANAAFAWLFYFWISPKSSQELKMFLGLLVFGICFYITPSFYNPTSEQMIGFNGQFLSWMSGSVSAVAVGMTLTKISDYGLLHKILPLECLILTPLLLQSILSYRYDLAQTSFDSGLNYQMLAYVMAELFAVCFYYSFIKRTNRHIIISLLTFVAMLLQSVACMMAGGRGGVVLIAIYLVYFLYYLGRSNIIKKSRLIIITIALIVGFSMMASLLDLSNSSGFLRSSGLVNDTDRTTMWVSIWHFITENSYKGYGLGGDYFTYGMYTHNILLDWMLELGIIGFLAMLFIYFKVYKRLLFLISKNEIYFLIMIIFIYGCVLNFFSGYWLNNITHWLCFGVVVNYRNIIKNYIIQKI